MCVDRQDAISDWGVQAFPSMGWTTASPFQCSPRRMRHHTVGVRLATNTSMKPNSMNSPKMTIHRIRCSLCVSMCLTTVPPNKSQFTIPQEISYTNIPLVISLVEAPCWLTNRCANPPYNPIIGFPG